MDFVGIGEHGKSGGRFIRWRVGSQADEELGRMHRSWKSRMVVVLVGIFLAACPPCFDGSAVMRRRESPSSSFKRLRPAFRSLPANDQPLIRVRPSTLAKLS